MKPIFIKPSVIVYAYLVDVTDKDYRIYENPIVNLLNVKSIKKASKCTIVDKFGHMDTLTNIHAISFDGVIWLFDDEKSRDLEYESILNKLKVHSLIM